MPVAKKAVKRQVEEMKIDQLKVETVLIDSLKLWKDNPRKNDEAAPKLAELIKVHGQRTPVVAWKKNSVIYKGNTTWKALKLLRAKTINVIFADFKSEQAAIAYGISDNKSSEFAEWDDELLKNFLMNDTINTGFTSDETHFMNLTVDEEFVKEIKAEQAEIKSRLVIVCCSASMRIKVREMLEKFFELNGIADKVEVK